MIIYRHLRWHRYLKYSSWKTTNISWRMCVIFKQMQSRKLGPIYLTWYHCCCWTGASESVAMVFTSFPCGISASAPQVLRFDQEYTKQDLRITESYLRSAAVMLKLSSYCKAPWRFLSYVFCITRDCMTRLLIVCWTAAQMSLVSC